MVEVELWGASMFGYQASELSCVTEHYYLPHLSDATTFYRSLCQKVLATFTILSNGFVIPKHFQQKISSLLDDL